MSGMNGKARLLEFLVERLPQRKISRLAGVFARSHASRALVAHFIRAYGVNMDEYAADAAAFGTLDEFFTRHLKPGARTIDPDANSVVSPTDGRLLSIGAISDGAAFQVKGNAYDVATLIGCRATARVFRTGWHFTVYLAPGDYHRIHAPLGGRIEKSIYRPGGLCPVIPAFAKNRRNLFAGNERVTTIIATHGGRCAVCKIGAMNVGSISLDYDRNFRTNVCDAASPAAKDYTDIVVQKGDGLGAFHLGSTVVVLTENADLRPTGITPLTRVTMGQAVLKEER